MRLIALVTCAAGISLLTLAAPPVGATTISGSLSAGVPSDISSQAGTTRVPRAKPKKMKGSPKSKKTPASTMPRSSNQ